MASATQFPTRPYSEAGGRRIIGEPFQFGGDATEEFNHRIEDLRRLVRVGVDQRFQFAA